MKAKENRGNNIGNVSLEMLPWIIPKHKLNKKLCLEFPSKEQIQKCKTINKSISSFQWSVEEIKAVNPIGAEQNWSPGSVL